MNNEFEEYFDKMDSYAGASRALLHYMREREGVELKQRETRSNARRMRDLNFGDESKRPDDLS